MLDKAAILAVDDFQYRELTIEEWGGEVRLRSLSAADRDKFEAELAQTQDLTNLRARLVCRAIVDENGTRMFSDAEAKQLGEKNANVVNYLFEAVREMNGMDDAALENAEGN